MPQPIIQVDRLTKTFQYHRKEPGLWGSIKSFFVRRTQERIAVADISFEVNEGEVVGFIGPNGAGKTTTMKMMSGVLHPTRGQVQVLGYMPKERNDDYLKQIAFVMGQRGSLFGQLPAMELFLLLKDIYEIPTQQFDSSLEMLTTLTNAEDILDIQVRKLSFGQRMKCELIARLLHMPRVLFLDEPTIGLDVSSKAMIREFFGRYNRQTDATIILTSHYLEDIQALCRRIIFIDHGRIIFDGPIDELITRYAPSVYISVEFNDRIGDDDLKGLRTIGDSQPDETQFKCRVKVDRTEAATASRTILNDFSVKDIRVEEAELEDVIRHLSSDR
jgi:ABC-2 type transport system ATP-binding protein